MNSETGENFNNKIEELQQDIKYILTTYKASMPLSKDFGTNILDLLGKNLTQSDKLRLFEEIYNSLEISRPDLKINKIDLSQVKSHIFLSLDLEQIEIGAVAGKNLTIIVEL